MTAPVLSPLAWTREAQRLAKMAKLARLSYHHNADARRYEQAQAHALAMARRMEG